MKKKSIVAVVDAGTYKYPSKDTLFRPHIQYPELEKLEFEVSNSENAVYEAVRESLHLLKFDIENYGEPEWNPLQDIVFPGDTVLIKPNLVMDHNLNSAGGVKCLCTQPGVVAPIIDYIIIAQKGKGKIIIGDAPMQECVFSGLLKECGYDELVCFYQRKSVNIEIVDFRELTSVVKNGIHYNTINKNASGKIIDLAEKSEFWNIDNSQLKKMRITNYDPRILNTHHNKEKQEYYVSDYVLNADVIINMPKPKSHRKAGVTISLKNSVGINTRKEFLPHHTKGSKNEGGDEYEKESFIHSLRSVLIDRLNISSANKRYNQAKTLRIIVRALSLVLKAEKTPNSEGSWWGNETISKTISDLNKIIFYADKDGTICEKPVRRMLIVADMIISGEKEGPVAPTPKNVGMIAAGTNPVCFDEMIATIMGFDYLKIPSIRCSRNMFGNLQIVEKEEFPQLASNCEALNGCEIKDITKSSALSFEPTSGWKNHIEL